MFLNSSTDNNYLSISMKGNLLKNMILTIIISFINIKQVFNYNRQLICSFILVFFFLFCLSLAFIVLAFSVTELRFLATCSLSATILQLSAFSLILLLTVSVLSFSSTFPSSLFLFHRPFRLICSVETFSVGFTSPHFQPDVLSICRGAL